MSLFRKIIYIGLLFIGGCINPKKDKLCESYYRLCNHLNLTDCAVENRYSIVTNDGDKEDLILSFKEAENLPDFYKKKSAYLFGKIALEMMFSLDSLGLNQSYSSIIISGIVNNKKEENKYSINSLKHSRELVNKVDDFFSSVDANSSFNTIQNNTDTTFIKDSTLHSVLVGLKKMSKGGEVSEKYISGIAYDKIVETGQEITIIVINRTRKLSQETFTFYFLNENKKIIFIDMQSSIDCN